MRRGACEVKISLGSQCESIVTSIKSNQRDRVGGEGLRSFSEPAEFSSLARACFQIWLLAINEGCNISCCTADPRHLSEVFHLFIRFSNFPMATGNGLRKRKSCIEPFARIFPSSMLLFALHFPCLP